VRHVAAGLVRSAPIPASSGNTHRVRLNQGGNRRLNAAIHRIAITQMRMHEPARTYLDARRAKGNSNTEAIRAGDVPARPDSPCLHESPALKCHIAQRALCSR
jgi:transposase